MVDTRKFLLDSDYPIDKIIGTFTGSIPIAASDFNDITIPHGFTSTPLYYIRWSYSSDFSTSYEETGNSAGFSVFVGCETNNTNIIIRTTNLTASPLTVYYRVILFPRYDVSYDVTNTQNNLDTFNLNTDYNYPKIYAEGYLPKVSGTFVHGLGYRPTVEAWFVLDNGTFSRFLGSSFGVSAQYNLLVDTNTINWTNSISGLFQARVYYRIYGDEI